MTDLAIEVKNLSKLYPYSSSFSNRLDILFSNLFSKNIFKSSKKEQYFHALSDISFDVRKGEAFGILGKNGAGKSTLLQIIAKTILPTIGSVKVNGRVNALLELGSGFNFEFTGSENIYLNGTILGFSKNEIDSKYDEIIEFSEIEKFIDKPIKQYSSGMLVRLAFSVQAMLEPDILIIDEALAVGDIFFVQKCHKKIEELLNRKKTTFLFVSHDLLSVQKYCRRVMVLDHGVSKFIGEPKQAIYEFQNIQSKLNQSETPIDYPHDQKSGKFNLNSVEIVGRKNLVSLVFMNIIDEDGESNLIFPSGSMVIFEYHFKILDHCFTPVVGIEIFNSHNILINSVNTLVSEQKLEFDKEYLPGEILKIRQSVHLPLEPGQYLFSVGFNMVREEIYNKKNRLSSSELNSSYLEAVRFINLPILTINNPKDKTHPNFYGLVELENQFEFESSKL